MAHPLRCLIYARPQRGGVDSQDIPADVLIDLRHGRGRMGNPDRRSCLRDDGVLPCEARSMLLAAMDLHALLTLHTQVDCQPSA